MTLCMLIPDDKDQPLVTTSLVTVDDFEMAVGGKITNVYLRPPSLLMYSSFIAGENNGP